MAGRPAVLPQSLADAAASMTELGMTSALFEAGGNEQAKGLSATPGLQVYGDVRETSRHVALASMRDGGRLVLPKQ